MLDDLTLLLDNPVDIVLEDDQYADMTLVDDIPYAEHYEEYEGQTIVTPEANEMQILQTENKVVRENIVVMPIPSNYGLITYNGRTITVS